MVDQSGRKGRNEGGLKRQEGSMPLYLTVNSMKESTVTPFGFETLKLIKLFTGEIKNYLFITYIFFLLVLLFTLNTYTTLPTSQSFKLIIN